MTYPILPSLSFAHRVSVVCAIGLFALSSPAQAAQCLTKMVEAPDGSLVQMQVLEPSGGPKKLISSQGFARSNCKELDVKAQAYADEACAQADTLPPEIQRLIETDFGFSLGQMCTMGKNAAKEAKAAAKETKKTGKTED